ncbi:hypothetical protein ACPFP2_27755 [Micromonospora citrea]|uniref:hypothetical protein n=1 Tax=Micromonospora citrea TaxID=47855 RepID=UPI003C63CACA
MTARPAPADSPESPSSGYTRTVTTQDTTEAPQALWEVIYMTVLIDRELATASVN